MRLAVSSLLAVVLLTACTATAVVEEVADPITEASVPVVFDIDVFCAEATVTSIMSAEECETLHLIDGQWGEWTLEFDASPSDPCAWPGLRCQDGGLWGITRLGGDLAADGSTLTGPIPTELAQLQNLQLLGLEGNELSGVIPPELAQLTNLGLLDLGNNNLSGAIPPELGQLANLQTLVLHNNNLTGPIPPELAQLTNLLNLVLSSNQLSGQVPPGLAQLPNLERLELEGNDFTGDVPGED